MVGNHAFERENQGSKNESRNLPILGLFQSFHQSFDTSLVLFASFGRP